MTEQACHASSHPSPVLSQRSRKTFKRKLMLACSTPATPQEKRLRPDVNDPFQPNVNPCSLLRKDTIIPDPIPNPLPPDALPLVPHRCPADSSKQINGLLSLTQCVHLLDSSPASDFSPPLSPVIRPPEPATRFQEVSICNSYSFAIIILLLLHYCNIV